MWLLKNYLNIIAFKCHLHINTWNRNAILFPSADIIVLQFSFLAVILTCRLSFKIRIYIIDKIMIPLNQS
ncbi:unnamed protein product [Schistosoma rodhaini]|uniref:Uncharacterized protein n=1 Tax=Schistosoma rodhaini TaxID=6188 RepID=A0AA85EK40_9TREM|nr:unnamed protein product [Schistosoma rodhaini]